jgi:putative copper resistance protein D
MAFLPCIRALHIVATMLLGGALAFDFLILRRCGEAARDAAIARVLDRWIAKQCAWAIAIGFVSWVAWLAAVSVTMSGLPVMEALAPDVVATVLARTTFGHVWLIRVVTFLILALLVWRRSARGLAFALAAILAASLAWTGHALGSNRLHPWVDALHLLAASAWLGMLPLLGLVMKRGLTGDSRWRELGIASAGKFFLPGVIAVLVLVATGLANTSWMVEAVSDLIATTYGRILCAKLALFATMLVLAFVNRRAVVAREKRAANDEAALRTLRAGVVAEIVVGAAILVVVAWLGVTPPVAHDRAEHRMEGM